MREPGPTPGEKSDYLLNTLAGFQALLSGADPFAAVPDQAAVDEEMSLRASRRLRTDDAILDQIEAKYTPRPGLTIEGSTAEIQQRFHEYARLREARGVIVTDRGPGAAPQPVRRPGQGYDPLDSVR